MNIVLWIIFGALVGWVASIIMGTNDRQGALGNILVGIVGSLIGGFIGRTLWGEGVTGFNFISFLIALGGALLFTAALQMFSHNKTI